MACRMARSYQDPTQIDTQFCACSECGSPSLERRGVSQMLGPYLCPNCASSRGDPTGGFFRRDKRGPVGEQFRTVRERGRG